MADNRKNQQESLPATDQPKTVGDEKRNSAVPSDMSVDESTQEIRQPSESVDELKRLLDIQNDKYLRLFAEFDNFKKRTNRDYERLVESANERLMSELIEVRENLERALKAGEQCDNVNALLDGMRLIFTRFDGVLVKNGLKAFGAEGDLFDPQLHDALMKIPHEKIPENHIAEVFEKGYSLKKKVIKHAKVVVSAGDASTQDKTKE